MNRVFKTILLAMVIFVGGWLLYHRQQIDSFTGAWQLAKEEISQNTERLPNPFELVRASEFVRSRNHLADHFTSTNHQNNQVTIPPSQRPTIRIASFKLSSQTRGNVLKSTADICQQYDVVALQNYSNLPVSKLVNELNSRGFDFRFVDQVGTDSKFATIFNQQAVQLEQGHWYTVNDPEDLFLFEPLVAWFRVSTVAPEEAFTFTLVNIQLNERRPDQELTYLDELFRSIRLDGRGEDDIILAGDFYSNDRQMRKLEKENGLKPAIIGLSTNTRKDAQLDNLIFDPKATIEFAGETGVFDFMKRFNMTLSEALEVSNRMPVWAEFSIFEGRAPGRAAERGFYGELDR